eukprot:gene19234-22995_t
MDAMCLPNKWMLWYPVLGGAQRPSWTTDNTANQQQQQQQQRQSAKPASAPTTEADRIKDEIQKQLQQKYQRCDVCATMQALGINVSGGTEQDVRKAYKKAALKFHPDRLAHPIAVSIGKVGMPEHGVSIGDWA